MKNKFVLLFFVFFIILSGNLYGYQEIETSMGRVIYGISRQEALEEFGPPLSIERDVWKYSYPEEFFIYFPPKATVTIFPRQMEAGTNVPLEFKVFAQLYNTEIKDVTVSAQIIPDKPEAFKRDKSGNLLASQAGKYILFAKYNDSLSNPCYLTITAAGGQEEEAEKLLSIDIFPFKPQTVIEGGIDFTLVGTFLDTVKGAYSVRNIERDFELEVEHEGRTAIIRNKYMRFPAAGKFFVVCSYKGLKSYRQECLITMTEEESRHSLKHLSLLPEFMQVPVGSRVILKAYGTYYDNRVDNIIGITTCNIDKKNLLVRTSFEEFLAEDVGIVQVYAEKDGVKSLPVKIVIVPASSETAPPVPAARKKQEAVSQASLASEIRENADKLSGAFSSKEKRPVSLRIEPDHLQLSKGEEGKFQAMLTYVDNSRQDVTLLSEWTSSNNSIAMVAEGKITTFFEGSAEVRAKYKAATSLPASIVVGPPRLVSIALSPQEASISMKERVVLKAEGHYSDSSHKDISSLVEWHNDRPYTVKVNNGGEISPIWFGSAKISASYSGINSLPANIRVVFTLGWLLEQLLKLILLLLLLLSMAIAVFFVITKAEEKKLRQLFYSRPREFIIALYGNLCRALAIFGFHNKNYLPPLSFASVVENAYNIKDNTFLKLTVKYEEAKYSNHSIGKEDAVMIADCYNAILSALYKKDSRFVFLYNYCVSLFKRIPLGRLKF